MDSTTAAVSDLRSAALPTFRYERIRQMDHTRDNYFLFFMSPLRLPSSSPRVFLHCLCFRSHALQNTRGPLRKFRTWMTQRPSRRGSGSIFVFSACGESARPVTRRGPGAPVGHECPRRGRSVRFHSPRIDKARTSPVAACMAATPPPGETILGNPGVACRRFRAGLRF